MDDKEIVSAVRRTLADRVGSERFDLWFGDRVEFSWSGARLKLAAPNPFTLDRLRRTLRADIEAACREITGSSEVELRLQTAPTEPAPAAPTKGRRGRANQSQASSQSQSNSTSTTMKNSAAHRSTSSAARGGDVEPEKRGASRDRDGRERDSHERTRESKHAESKADSKADSKSAETRGADSRASDSRGGDSRNTERGREGSNRARGFTGFVVGDSNRLAFTAAQNVAARPGNISPLFLHGPSGSGKTHLLEALIENARRRSTVRRAVYLSAEQFTSQFLEALRGSGLPSFRRKYRDVDLLVIDDVQFFSGKKATAIELQYTLDTLNRSNRQLVLAADRPPSELSGMGAELVARMSGGLVCPVEPADEKVRLGILQQAAKRLELSVPNDLMKVLSQQLSGDARFLTGALNRLQAASCAHGKPVNLELAQATLTDVFRATRRVVRLPDIERAVCDVLGLDPRSLQSDRKVRTVSQPRMLAMWLARKHTRAALSEIGQFFGRRSHTSVISAQKKVDQALAGRGKLLADQIEGPLAETVRRVEAQLRMGA